MTGTPKCDRDAPGEHLRHREQAPLEGPKGSVTCAWMALPAASARCPLLRPITSTRKRRLCAQAVMRHLSIASNTILSRDSRVHAERITAAGEYTYTPGLFCEHWLPQRCSAPERRFRAD